MADILCIALSHSAHYEYTGRAQAGQLPESEREFKPPNTNEEDTVNTGFSAVFQGRRACRVTDKRGLAMFCYLGQAKGPKSAGAA
jgi:hypothetical protein